MDPDWNGGLRGSRVQGKALRRRLIGVETRGDADLRAVEAQVCAAQRLDEQPDLLLRASAKDDLDSSA
jgi:hypothetical protein